MKKQTTLWLSLLLLSILGGFYVQPLLAKDEPLKMEIRTISGDEALLEGLTYYGTANNQWELTTLSLDRSGLRHTETQRQDAFFHEYAENAVLAWRSDYRSFMRGKSSFQGNYSETEENLYYVESEEDGFSLETLDKESGTASETLLVYPEKKEKNYYAVNQTFFLDGRIVIEYSRYDNHSNPIGSDIVIYNPISGSLEEHSVFEMPQAVAGYKSISTDVLTQDDRKGLFVMVRTEETDWEATEYAPPVISISFKRYDWDTKQWMDLANTADFSNDSLPYAIADGIFYQLHQSDGDWTIQALDLMQDKPLETIVLQNTGDWRRTYDTDWQILISDTRAVLTKNYLEPDRTAQLSVFDLQTGESLYSGEITGSFVSGEETNILYFNKIVYEP